MASGYSTSMPKVRGKRTKLVHLMAEEGVTGLLLLPADNLSRG